jgi:hypothetical protein
MGNEQTDDLDTKGFAMSNPLDLRTTPKQKPEPVNEPNVKPESGSDDGVMESIGKALTDPIRSAADDEELPDDRSHAPVPPG